MISTLSNPELFIVTVAPEMQMPFDSLLRGFRRKIRSEGGQVNFEHLEEIRELAPHLKKHVNRAKNIDLIAVYTFKYEDEFNQLVQALINRNTIIPIAAFTVDTRSLENTEYEPLLISKVPVLPSELIEPISNLLSPSFTPRRIVI